MVRFLLFNVFLFLRFNKAQNKGLALSQGKAALAWSRGARQGAK
jgi:hypothetical protein